jgi:cytochrome bd-type quinol oxidase subunit 2
VTDKPLLKSGVVAVSCGLFEYVILWLLLDDPTTLNYVFVVSMSTFYVSEIAQSVRLGALTDRERAALAVGVESLLIAFVLFCAVVVIASIRFLNPDRFIRAIEYVPATLIVLVVYSRSFRTARRLG